MDKIEEGAATVTGANMYEWARDLFPICRSLTGKGVRDTLAYISGALPEIELVIHEIPSGTKVYDWVIPDEWEINSGQLLDDQGNILIDFCNNNLHVVGYSEPVDAVLRLDQLNSHLHSIEDQPDAIPYVTSYYERNWGFCLTHNCRSKLVDGNYRVKIDSSLKPGFLNYGEVFIPGESDDEIFLSTYICHPSLANNELSGPVVAMAIIKWLRSLKRHKYSYRILFNVETIGALAYFYRKGEHLKKNVKAAFNLTCMGDNLAYSFLPSRNGDSLADKVARHVLNYLAPNYKEYSWLERGSDERQYCSPGADLPMCSIMRSKYGEYPEYHTSLDNLDFICPEGLSGGFDALRYCLMSLEANCSPIAMFTGEPQLGKYGLYPNLSIKNNTSMDIRGILNLLTYADGARDLIDIANLINIPAWKLSSIVQDLSQRGLIGKN